jgi:hypothetical protein
MYHYCCTDSNIVQLSRANVCRQNVFRPKDEEAKESGLLAEEKIQRKQENWGLALN